MQTPLPERARTVEVSLEDWKPRGDELDRDEIGEDGLENFILMYSGKNKPEVAYTITKFCFSHRLGLDSSEWW